MMPSPPFQDLRLSLLQPHTFSEHLTLTLSLPSVYIIWFCWFLTCPPSPSNSTYYPQPHDSFQIGYRKSGIFTWLDTWYNN